MVMLFLLKKIAQVFLLALFLLPSFVHANELTLNDYVATFYNRYSLNFDDNGFKYSVPNYGIKDFKVAESPRELMSLAMYYRYRAMSGEEKAIEVMRQSILRSRRLLNEKPAIAMSFEDANAQFLMWIALDDIELGIDTKEIEKIEREILSRAKDGLDAKDTSNRAALSSAYWQYLVVQGAQKGYITKDEKQELDDLIKYKIDKIKNKDISKDGWYVEGDKRWFNPHYHLVTSMALLFYGEYSGSEDYISLAKKMTNNLRSVTFSNGMVESMIGERPVGLGAQFYLGAGMLNWRFGYVDYGTYLNYAKGNVFFSDKAHPNRLEYHSTRSGEEPNYHDDYAFSSLAEMVKLLNGASEQVIEFSNKLNSKNNSKIVANNGNSIMFHGRCIEQVGKYTSTMTCRSKSKIGQIDSDSDGINDSLELVIGTDPYNRDTDGDGYSDGEEFKSGYDPLDKRPRKKIAKK